MRLLPNFLRPKVTPQSPPVRVTIGDLARLFDGPTVAQGPAAPADNFSARLPLFAAGPCAGNCGRLAMRMRAHGDDFLLAACPSCGSMARGLIVS